MTLEILLAQQQNVVDGLKERLGRLDAILHQAQQERTTVLYDLLKEVGKLEGFQQVLGTRASPRRRRKDATTNDDQGPSGTSAGELQDTTSARDGAEDVSRADGRNGAQHGESRKIRTARRLSQNPEPKEG